MKSYMQQSVNKSKIQINFANTVGYKDNHVININIVAISYTASNMFWSRR